MAFRRQALLEIGGFDEFYKYIAEETDVAVRLAQRGELMQPVRGAAVYHVPASSRNRIIFQAVNRIWRLATRSQTYFSIKNGPGAGDSRRAILLRCLHIVHGHWLAFGQLHRGGRITGSQFLSMSMAELPGLAAGVFGGLFRPRGLITPSAAQSRLNMKEPIVEFQTDRSALQPAVDPVSGAQPSITLNDPPLRICLLSKSYPPTEYDGVGRLTNLMARGLFELGHTVHVITGGETERVAFYDGAYVHVMPYALDRYPDYKRYVNLFHTLNRNHAVYETVQRLRLNDGVQLVDSPLWLYEGLVTALSGVIPVVVRLVTAHRQVTALHGQRADDHRLVGEMEKLLIERSAHVLPNTRATLQAVEKAYGLSLPTDRYTIVPYGLVPAPEETIRPYDTRRRDDELTVLFVGRLEKRKGIQDLFEAIPQVLQRIPRAKFVIAGSDNSYWDGFLKRTGMDYPTYFAQHYAAFAPHVTFAGSVSDDELQRLYAACDLFVAPSLYESFGLIYLEAMNYAKPVIGCRAGGIPEVIDHQSTGLVVEPEAPRQLAEAIVSMLKSPTQLREMGLAGRQQILQRFHYLTMARNFERVYRQVIQAFEQGRTPNGL
jgi:glycogen(starch) synthase